MLIPVVSASVVLFSVAANEDAGSVPVDGKRFFDFDISREERLSDKEFHTDGTINCAAGRFTIKVTYAGAGRETPYKEYWGWDDFNKDKKYPFIIDINARRPDGNWYDIPQSAYADLGDPNALSLTCKDGGFTAEIQGSDAGGSYRATFEFSKTALTSRTVHHGEFPERYRQTTEYHCLWPMDEEDPDAGEMDCFLDKE